MNSLTTGLMIVGTLFSFHPLTAFADTASERTVGCYYTHQGVTYEGQCTVIQSSTGSDNPIITTQIYWWDGKVSTIRSQMVPTQYGDTIRTTLDGSPAHFNCEDVSCYGSPGTRYDSSAGFGFDLAE